MIIADISGYTSFMLANRTAISHGQGIISDLLRAVIEEVRIPLTVEKLEGDAVFLAAQRTPGEDWHSVCASIGKQLPEFVSAFERKLCQLADQNACPCPTCLNMHRLSLKVVGHLGGALRYTLGRFDELAGPDVIAVHRLLKNSIPASSYLLLTEAAFQSLQPVGDWEATTEQLEGMGTAHIRWRSLRAPVTSVSAHPMSLRDHVRKLKYGLAWGLQKLLPRP